MKRSPGLLILIAAAAFSQNEPKFVRIPAGSFVMGCDPGWKCAETMPKKRIDFAAPFEMMRSETTVAQFTAFANASGYQTEAEKAGDKFNWRSPGFKLDDRHPVVFMTLNDAKAYCEFIKARVPFEAEWEYAARAGSTTWHYWGEEIDDRYLWYFSNSDEHPEPVGRKRPNAWGLHDVEGNAMEWVQYGGPYSSITNPNGGTVRGGSYASCPKPYPPAPDGRINRTIGLSVTFPDGANSNFRANERRFDYGFRCVR